MRRRVCIRQRDSADCGPACIASVLSYHRSTTSVARIRQLAGTDQQGTSMWGMIRALEKLGFESRGLRGSPEHLGTLPLPFIAHLEGKDEPLHYVTVYRLRRERLWVMDPATGKLSRWSLSRFLERWSGAVIAMVRSIPVPGPPKETSGSLRLLRLLQPLRVPILQALLSGILHTLLGLSSSIYIGKLTDHVFYTQNAGLLNLMSSAMAIIAVIMAYLLVIRNIIVLKTGQVLDNQLIISYIRHLFRLPQRFFDTMKTGEILSRINDAVKIRAFVNDAVVGIAVNILVVLCSFVTMFIMNPRLTLLMAGIIPFYLLIYLFFNHRNRLMERKVMEHSASLESQLVESIHASTHIRQHDLAANTLQKSERHLNRLLDALYRSGLNLISVSGGTDLVTRLFTILLLWVGSHHVIQYQITPGKLLSFYALLGYFTGPVTSLIGANRTLQNALIAADRLFEIYQLEPAETGRKRIFRREQFGDIDFRGVSFAHGCRGFLFRDLNFTLEAGRITALTGASGTGKSTIASLIQCIYPVHGGKITINGYDTRLFSAESIRGIMGVVPQQITFLTGSLLENIAPGQREPDLGKIHELIRDLGLTGLVDSLEGGLEHPMAENGNHLSGGERQRLALARALYRQPSLLIMDEGLSSLDLHAVKDLQRYLDQRRTEGMTILLITHRTHYAGIADHLLLLENARIRPMDHKLSEFDKK